MTNFNSHGMMACSSVTIDDDCKIVVSSYGRRSKLLAAVVVFTDVKHDGVRRHKRQKVVAFVSNFRGMMACMNMQSMAIADVIDALYDGVQQKPKAAAWKLKHLERWRSRRVVATGSSRTLQ